MIVVTIDLYPMGLMSRKALNTVRIWNDGGGTATRGSYNYQIWSPRNRLIVSGHVDNFPRKSKTAVDLLQLVLDHAAVKLGQLKKGASAKASTSDVGTTPGFTGFARSIRVRNTMNDQEVKT